MIGQNARRRLNLVFERETKTILPAEKSVAQFRQENAFLNMQFYGDDADVLFELLSQLATPVQLPSFVKGGKWPEKE